MVGVVLSVHEVEIIVTLPGGDSCLSDYAVTHVLHRTHFCFKKFFFSFFLFTPLLCVYMHVCAHTCAIVCMWRSENKILELIQSYHMCARHQTWVVRLGSSHLESLTLVFHFSF